MNRSSKRHTPSRGHARAVAIAALWLGSTGAGAQGSAPPAQADQVIATFTGAANVAIPGAPCSTNPVVASFVETTPTFPRPAQGGSFEVELQTACVTPFMLAAGMPITAQFAFVAGPSRTPVMTYSLTNAYITEVGLETRTSGSTAFPLVRLRMLSSQVTLATPAPAPTPGAGKSASAPNTSGTVAAGRLRMPAFHPSTSITLVPVTAPGEGWARTGVHGVLQLSASNPPLTATSATTAFHLTMVVGTIEWYSSGAFEAVKFRQVSAPPLPLNFTKGVDATTPPIHAAAAAQAHLTQAVFTLVNPQGVAGITAHIAGQICKDQPSTANEEVDLVGLVTISDVGSGRSVTFPAGMRAAWSVGEMRQMTAPPVC